MNAGNGKGARGIPFILVGLILLFAAVLLVMYNAWDSDRAGKASAEVLEELDKIIHNAADTDPTLKLPNFTERPYRVMPTEEIDGYLVPQIGETSEHMKEVIYGS